MRVWLSDFCAFWHLFYILILFISVFLVCCVCLVNLCVATQIRTLHFFLNIKSTVFYYEYFLKDTCHVRNLFWFCHDWQSLLKRYSCFCCQGDRAKDKNIKRTSREQFNSICSIWSKSIVINFSVLWVTYSLTFIQVLKPPVLPPAPWLWVISLCFNLLLEEEKRS